MYVVDCAIRFRVFLLSEKAAASGTNPDWVLSRVQVRRVFTPYHILDAIELLKREKRKITFILAPLKQFFDPDVGKEEGLFLLHRMVDKLHEVRRLNSNTFIIEKQNYRHTSFQTIFPVLKDCCDEVHELRPIDEQKYLIQDQKALAAKSKFLDAKMNKVRGAY